MTIWHFFITFDIFNIKSHTTYRTFQTSFMPKLKLNQRINTTTGEKWIKISINSMWKKDRALFSVKNNNRQGWDHNWKIHTWFTFLSNAKITEQNTEWWTTDETTYFIKTFYFFSWINNFFTFAAIFILHNWHNF